MQFAFKTVSTVQGFGFGFAGSSIGLSSMMVLTVLDDDDVEQSTVANPTAMRHRSRQVGSMRRTDGRKRLHYTTQREGPMTHDYGFSSTSATGDRSPTAPASPQKRV